MENNLANYKRQGKKLIPPLLTIPNLSLESWTIYRMPEILWAVLVRNKFERDIALEIFKNISAFFFQNKDYPNLKPDVTFSGIAQQPDKIRKELIKTISEHAVGALQPLLLFPELPCYSEWEENIRIDESEQDLWKMLGRSISSILDSHDTPATDCRWGRLIPLISMDKLVFALPDRERAKELFFEYVRYPNYGDQNKVMSSIRAMEGGLSKADESNADAPWSNNFWKSCFENTICYPSIKENGVEIFVVDKKQIEEIRQSLIFYSNNSIETTGTDAKHESVFGIGLYALSLLEELVKFSSHYSISGRLLLRCLAEIYISLSYLVFIDDSELWKKYRTYGIGQSKLQSHKITEYGESVDYVNNDFLELIANEDQSDKFLEIGLGNWAGENLRKMSEISNTKQVYDLYFNWTSAYTHGGWGAIRESIYTTCLNPLHRFHQIPCEKINFLPSVLNDAVKICNSILKLVEQSYPEVMKQLSINTT
jgi:hypothetical protein